MPVSIIAILLIIFPKIMFSQTQDTDTNMTLRDFLINKEYIPIQLGIYATGHLYANIVMNNVKGKFILDSGAGATVMDEKRTEKYNLKATDSDDKATGAGGSDIETKISINNKLSIGNYQLDNYTIILMNLDHVNNAFKQLGLEGVEGVIGSDILSSGKAIIDYTNLILYLKK